MTTQLKLAKVSQRYGTKTILNDFSLTLDAGEIGCLLGPSGCGKTTALRCIAGFEGIHHGSITLAGNTLSSAAHHTPAHLRHIGMLFQDYALFPHLTVQENIAFGLNQQPKNTQAKRVSYLLDLVNMNGHAKQFPHQLSGGQQQRVALARSLAPQPLLLLLDEPFSSLDPELREQLAVELRQILKHESMSAIMVSHDQNEAFAFADKIGVMHNGQLSQWNDALTLYQQPCDLHVAKFIGDGSFIKGVALSNDRVQTEIGQTSATLPSASKINDEVTILLRPHDIEYQADSTHRAIVRDKKFHHGRALNTLQLPSGQIVLFSSEYHQHERGDEIGIAITTTNLTAFHTQP